MSSLGKALTLIAIVLLAGVGLVIWKAKVGGSHGSEGLTKLTKEDMELIFKDAPPQALKRLAEDPELKKKQIESIKQFLAIAEQARKEGFADRPENKEVLETIREQIVAVSYDREKNKDKELPPLSSITKEQVDAYYQTPANSEKFDKMIKEQIEKAKKDGRLPDNFEPPAEQLEQAKDQNAKIQISYKEAQENWSKLPEPFKHETDLQVKLQEAQFLAQKYSEEVLSKKVTATDEEVNQYLAAHPEEAKVLTEKKAKAEEILKRAQAGEDFGKLAEENSEDPGSKKDGGLYKEIGKGDMVPEFEAAALGLEPGKVAPSVIESKFGFHIIKLERKGATKGADGQEKETYDARHILFTTAAADPSNPMSQPVPLKEKVKAEIEKEKEKKLTDEILAKNPIEVAEDFVIKVPEMPAQPEGMPPGMNLDPKQMEQLQKQLKEMQEKQGAEKSAPKKPEPKK